MKFESIIFFKLYWTLLRFDTCQVNAKFQDGERGLFNDELIVGILTIILSTLVLETRTTSKSAS